MYDERKKYAYSTYRNGRETLGGGGELVWDSHGYSHNNNGKSRNRNYRNYWKLQNVEDLILQFNYVGFHDICNYPNSNQLHFYYMLNGIGTNLKKFYHYYPGYISKNTSG